MSEIQMPHPALGSSRSGKRTAASRSGFRARLERAIAVLRTEGLRSFWFKLLDATCYRRLLLLERLLTEPLPEVVTRIAVDIRMLTPEDLPEYLRFRPDAAAEDLRTRLAAGAWCFAAWHEGRMVSARWAAPDRLWIDHLAVELRLEPDEACSFDLFTSPEQRGNGVSPAVSAAMLRFLRTAGYRRMVVAIMPENHASLRSVEKTGYRPYGVIGYLELGPWRWRFCRMGSGRAA